MIEIGLMSINVELLLLPPGCSFPFDKVMGTPLHCHHFSGKCIYFPLSFIPYPTKMSVQANFWEGGSTKIQNTKVSCFLLLYFRSLSELNFEPELEV